MSREDPGHLLRNRPRFKSRESVLKEEFRVADGPDPKFGDSPEWNLIAAGLAPNVPKNIAVLNFADVPSDWRLTAKTIAMAMLQPTHPVLRSAAIFRSNKPQKIKTIQMTLYEFKALSKWATAQRLPIDFAQWTEVDYRNYLADVRRNRSKSAKYAVVELFKRLVTYGPILPNGQLGITIATQSRPKSSTVSTPAIPPATFWPLVRACWTYLSVFAPDIIAARDELDRLETMPLTGKSFRVGELDDALDAWLNSQDGFVPLHIEDWGRGLRGEPNWVALSLRVLGRRSGAVFRGPGGMPRRERVMKAIDRGFPTRLGVCDLAPTSVDRVDGIAGPWIAGFDHTVVGREITQLRNAAYIFVGIMTMMRDSEIQSITSGSTRTHYGAPAVESTLHKHQPGLGKPELWWVSEPVIEALKIAEEVALTPGRLFGSVRKGTEREMSGFEHRAQIHSFVACVNANIDRTGLSPIPTTPLAPHMFRRTMAVITANEPDGEIALGITLKHNAVRALANATTSGYGAPTPEWAKEFEHHAKDAAAGELVADWAQHAQGDKVFRGPGAATFLNGLDDVSQRANTTVAIGNERLLRDLLRDEFTTIRLGTLNHCLGDSEKSLCLDGASAAVRQSGPIPSMCQPATCRNSVVTEKHLPVWQHEEQELKRKLRDKRMAPVHRLRLEAQLADIRKITRQEPK